MTASLLTDPVTVMVARRVVPGAEAEAERWFEGVTAAAARFPGFLGAGVLRPSRAGEEWHVVYRFVDEPSLRRWESSPERRRWLERSGAVPEVASHRVTGLGAWFELPGRSAPAPPRWKMALATFSAIYPLVLLLNVLVLPSLVGLLLPLRVLVLSGLLVPLMTWVVMPRLTRLLAGWLYP